MRELADGVHLLLGFPRSPVNVYLIGDVLIDAGTRRAGPRILRELGQRPLKAHALTHVHPDHSGSSHAICERLGIPLWCGRDEVPAMERGGAIHGSKVLDLASRWWDGPPHPVSRALEEGEDVAGFTVLETPGHTRGHISLWREADRLLILGDVLMNRNPLSGRPGLREPPSLGTSDPARNRVSARRLAALQPSLTCFGHGPPSSDPARLAAFVDTLPRG